MSEWHSKPITTTGFDSQMCGDDGYEIHFYTDKKEAYHAVQEVCRQFIYRKPQTNADRIRAMPDEELAEFIEYLTSGCDYMYPKCYASEFCTSGVCHSAWLDWFKSPVEVDK